MENEKRMREEILLNIDNPGQLERLYRNDKPTFRSAFNHVYPQLRSNPLAEGWHQRLNYMHEDLLWGTSSERLFVLVASAVAALVARLPQLLSIDPEFFYTRNIGFIVFPVLLAYFGWKNGIDLKLSALVAGILLAAAVYMNMLPGTGLTDTLNLACIHLPFLMWALLGFVFTRKHTSMGWLGFVRFNGDLAVMLAVLLIAGGLTTALTINLFRLIGWDIQKVFFDNVVICGLAAVPMVATFLLQAQPTLVSKVSPVVARLFSPVALVMLVIYLVAAAFSEKNPYHDRDFLLLFNVLLVGVMALIFFSVAEGNYESKSRGEVWVLFLLSAVTLVVNGIALSAVLFRISEWGITPNRAAVLGANVLMLVHLMYVSFRLYGSVSRRADISFIARSMPVFVPVYFAWGALITFLFPLIFNFR